MSDFPVNEERENIEETAVDAENSINEAEFSTIFSAPTEHKVKSAGPKKKKRLLSVVAACLAVAVLVGGTVAVAKLIPEKETDEDTYADDSITVLDLDTDTFSSVTVKNSSGTYTLLASKQETETEDEDGETATTTETVWTVSGTDSKYTSSSSVEDIADSAASISAISEISGKTAAACGLDNPSYVIDIVYEDGSKTVNFGSKSADELGYYLQVSDDDKIYLVDSSVALNFEFELLDLADTTAIPGITATDEMSDYVGDDGTTLTTFDTITLTGTNFPQTLVISANNDGSDLSQYFNYTVTSPQYRIADQVDDLFAMFTGGLSVSGAYSFDVSSASLKAVGLDKPYLTATVKIGSYTQTYKIAKVDEENCAVITDDSYMIRKVSASSFSFLDFEAEDYYSKMAYIKSITDLSNLTLTAGAESYSFDIKYDEEAEDEKFEITYNGVKITAEFFQNFYQDFVGVTYTDFKNDCDISTLDMTITLTFLDGHKETVAYAKDSATKYACVINGENLGRVSSTDYNRLLKDIRNVAQNKDVP